MTAVQLKGVRKDFGGFTAISNIDLDIRSGELVALLGPSGCGKTTTLRMIAGLEVPSDGQILFDGKDVSEVAVQKRNVGMVFQRYALFPHMTVEKNVAFGLKVRGTDKAEIEQRLEDILDVVQLQQFRHRFPAQLSGGQMQRVAIARTLITNPSVLMMDEPLANLDTKLRGEMRRFIRDLQQRLGITTIFVTHDQIEAMELADRVAVIFDGKLAQYDAPDALYKRPGSIDIADFMGATNVFEAMIRGKTATAPFGSLAFATDATDGPAHVMLRGEAIDLHLAEPPETQNQIRGRVSAREFFGANITYTVACGDAQIQVIEQSRRMVDLDQEVWLTIPPDRIWIIQN
ncbi:ABC transporter ATP-binding protein [Ponticoccus sp. SC2-23]|uniref:ABC transporter ATP-binding protein n=1 Tax=Alexandriicola marinus TaxID=2081710 RepID=UPI000FD85FC7|nr:ABC transporter ATP-binding protein [Alexandriicola marinus]MBM1221264.1 ABC transporter ATP-binding protein [Ponticoccus sp. SC6-9]MBM1225834.1 ABC transporter ATP-binding protein [Ponticoccus sp. SC6-15]MBM1227986.1 ABC transporter ATP-binding protein [Ponticoccus sp. SC6-38]MBM1234376.1 ABC transporter ATP-binding protein [Ponticoccus sp. SC6-45]MBM1238488.1 ABC transporter ATP-binding protein [Ponticoccus sp. SC6-49]MBM1243757.1 ABC transporter ATP-binding protein [Ponticoccus sp. SC2-